MSSEGDRYSLIPGSGGSPRELSNDSWFGTYIICV